LRLTEPLSEKYLKKLVGNSDNRTDIEDALRRLDRLTEEEAQMAAAQVLKATHATDDTGRVRGVADIVLGVGDQLKDVDNKVTVVMDGM
jgi:hypothetical protein